MSSTPAQIPVLFDSHCHLDSPDLAADIDAVLARARAAGVRYLVNIGSGYGPDEAEKSVRTAEAHPDVWATVGVHPHDAEKVEAGTLARMRDLARSPKVVAWGEIGLDYWYEHSPRDVQMEVFRQQIEHAIDLDLPISLHVRGSKSTPAGERSDAASDLLVVLRDVRAQVGDALRGVWHCFTEDPDSALEAVEMGFSISIPGIVTFPKGENVRRAAQVIPLDKLVVETDSPYLAPLPHRGQRNEPAYVVETVKKIAELKGVPFEEVAEATTRNARAVYEIDRERDA